MAFANMSNKTAASRAVDSHFRASSHLALVLAISFSFGYATNQIPSWEFLSGPAIWVNELTAPYALAAVAGGAALPQARASAAIAGFCAVAAAFFGYYLELSLKTDYSLLQLLTPWNSVLPLEVMLGSVGGLIGRRWVLRREKWTAVLIASAPVVEAAAFATGISGTALPFLNLFPPTYPWTPWNVAFWFAEALMGTLLGLLLLRDRGVRPSQR